jgi:Primase C terminal 2 (PriCT-2)
MLEPDRGEIEAFVDALFQHAGDKGFVAVRSFFEEKDKPFRLSTAKLSGGLQFLIDVAEDDARRAAQNPTPVVFAPPIAVFAGKDRAGEEDVLLGLALSVECDQHPNEEAFAAWSAKAKKNVAETTNARWQHYRTSPPSRIGFGSLVYWARHYQPGWTYAAAGSLSGANAASGAGSESTVATLNKVHAVLPIGGKTRVVTFGELEEFPGRETIVMTQTIAGRIQLASA